jgi:predicted amidohydrolase YtcJ
MSTRKKSGPLLKGFFLWDQTFPLRVLIPCLDSTLPQPDCLSTVHLPTGQLGGTRDQKLTREQALKGMTLDAAYASFAENDIGSLSPGKKADFVILDKDIMTLPVEEILNTRVVATVVDGTVVYGNL